MWTGMIIIALLLVVGVLAGIGFWVYVLWRYPYKVSYRKVCGDVNQQISLGKRRKKHVGKFESGSVWKAFLRKKKMPPIPSEAIMTGNEIDCYLLPDGTFIPATHNIKKDGESIRAHMNAIFPEAKSWAINDLREIARNHDPRSKIDMIKTMGLVILAILIGVAAFVAGVYGGYKAFTYGSDKGSESAIVGANVCGQTIANTIAARFANYNESLKLTTQVVQAKSIIPLPIGGTT